VGVGVGAGRDGGGGILDPSTGIALFGLLGIFLFCTSYFYF
jgi:hypothetical protein